MEVDFSHQLKNKKMKSKSKINGFKPFSGYDDISDGLKIPVGKTVEPSPVEPKQTTPKRPIQPFSRVSTDIDHKAFTPMTNLVPTIQPVSVPTSVPVVVPTQEPKYKGLTRRQKQRICPEGLNMSEYGALATKPEKITYLAMRGWSLKEEIRGNTFYHYATKYIKRKKKRLYLGSVNEC